MSILADQSLELPIVGGVLSDEGSLVGGHVAGEGFAVFPALQIVIGAIGAVPNDAEFARFHGLDLGDLLEEVSRIELVHVGTIYDHIHLSTKKHHFSGSS